MPNTLRRISLLRSGISTAIYIFFYKIIQSFGYDRPKYGYDCVPFLAEALARGLGFCLSSATLLRSYTTTTISRLCLDTWKHAGL